LVTSAATWYFYLENFVIEKLTDLLVAVRNKADREFSGIGIIVYKNSISLPIFPLRLTSPQLNENDIVGSLAKISSLDSEYHDGFHLISCQWKITHVAQYFSPPVVSTLNVDRTRLFGGRYIAALFGSTLPDIECCGIASNGFGVAVFKNGKEVLFKELF
jgi:hypothetical protein